MRAMARGRVSAGMGGLSTVRGGWMGARLFVFRAFGAPPQPSPGGGRSFRRVLPRVRASACPLPGGRARSAPSPSGGGPGWGYGARRRHQSPQIPPEPNPTPLPRPFNLHVHLRSSTMHRHALAVALVAAIALAACSTRSEHVADAPPPPPPPSPSVMAEDFMDSLAPAARTRAQAAQRAMSPAMPLVAAPAPADAYTVLLPEPANTENYAEREDNPVQRVAEQPVSTFSVDVDTGSYSNVRRMIRDGVRPPPDAVRAEEFINYFSYGHPGPESLDAPFRATTRIAPAPWDGRRHLLMIGIKGYDVPKAELPPANLVFLFDTSGSMNSPDKLPLLKQAFSELTRQLRPQDR